MTTATDLWAPFGLRVRCGSLELRAITDNDMPALVDLELAGITDLRADDGKVRVQFAKRYAPTLLPAAD